MKKMGFLSAGKSDSSNKINRPRFSVLVGRSRENLTAKGGLVYCALAPGRRRFEASFFANILFRSWAIGRPELDRWRTLEKMSR
jgi:hypothetical protein